MKKNYYEILGVPRYASMNQIRTKYKELRQKYDPKLNPGKKESKKWLQIKEAYHTLSDKEKRKTYDAQLEAMDATETLTDDVTSAPPVEEEKEKPTLRYTKAYFLPRILAYVFDAFLITFVASFLFSFFPQAETVQKLNEQQIEVQEQFLDQEIDVETYIAQSLDLSYDIAYQNVIYVIFDVALGVLYFVVFQYKNQGQTLGKKLMRVRIVSSEEDGKVSINQYLFRALILQAILINVLSVIGVLVFSKDIYGSFSYGLSFVQIGINLVTLFMILFRKDGRGVHDVIAKTWVVMDDSEEKVLCEN